MFDGGQQEKMVMDQPWNSCNNIGFRVHRNRFAFYELFSSEYKNQLGNRFFYAKEEDVADYLKSEVKKYELKITEHAGLSDMITGKEISVEYKENGVIDKLLKEQSVFLWPAAWLGEGKRIVYHGKCRL